MLYTTDIKQLPLPPRNYFLDMALCSCLLTGFSAQVLSKQAILCLTRYTVDYIVATPTPVSKNFTTT